jgi:hypothetical protein
MGVKVAFFRQGLNAIGAKGMQCPYCAEEIRNNAIVCKHCHRDLTFYTPVSRRIDELDVRLTKIEQALLSFQHVPEPTIDQPEDSSQSQPASFYVAVLVISLVISTASYAYYRSLPSSREWALLFSILTPFFTGLLIGVIAAERSLTNMLAVGAANGLLASIGVVGVILAVGHRVNWVAVFTLYFLPPSLLLFLGGFPGEWLAQKMGRRTQKPYYARTLARVVVAEQPGLQDETEKDKRLDRLTKSIAALAPLLTFLASIIAAGLAYLGTIQPPAKP